MVCLRCGYCCKNYFVPIVNDPDKGLDENNIIEHIGDGTPCIHLEGDEPGEYSCKLHNFDWYKDTPCFSHGQIERNPNTPCRLGKHILEKK